MNICLALILGLLSIFYSCSDSQKTNRKVYGYNTYQNLDWGISKDNCMKQLKVTKEDIHIIESNVGENGESFYIEDKVWGKTAKIYFHFMNRFEDIKSPIGLYSVSIDFGNVSNPLTIKEKLKKRYYWSKN